jgi:hypothetical protein
VTAPALPPPAVPARPTLAIASLVCGIVALVLAIIWPAGIVLAILALAFGGVTRWGPNRVRSGLATAGLWLGAVALLASITIGVLHLTGVFDGEPDLVCTYTLESQRVECRNA